VGSNTHHFEHYYLTLQSHLIYTLLYFLPLHLLCHHAQTPPLCPLESDRLRTSSLSFTRSLVECCSLLHTVYLPYTCTSTGYEPELLYLYQLLKNAHTMAHSPSPDPVEAGQYQPASAPPPTFPLPQEFRQVAVKVKNIDSLVAQ